MAILRLVALVLALSLDSLVVGVAYGLRGIRVPLRPLLTLGLVSFAGLAASMLVGVGAGTLISPLVARLIGGLLLIGIGAYTLLKAWLDATAGRANADKAPRVAVVRLRSLGLIIQILRDPAAADTDASGDLTVTEALTLGVALSIDALAVGAGIGIVSQSWLTWLLPPAAGLGTAGLLAAGHAAGRRGVALQANSRLGYLPGFILIALGLSQLLF